jgi:TPR repeat protein
MLVRIGFLLLLLCTQVFGDYASGLQAYRDGDYAEALKEFLPLAKQGNVNAQFYLGCMYELGSGVRQDNREAMRWYRAAADQGHALAQFDLGDMYSDIRDYKEAIRWLRLAADHGIFNAQTNLGIMYAQGVGVQQDYVESIRWFRLAADRGNGVAQFNLGLMFAVGHGVPRDDIHSYMWLMLARGNGFPDANMLANKMEYIASSMTPSQIAEARQLARNWKPKDPGR